MIPTRGRFANEADELSPIAAASPVLAGHGPHSFFEVALVASVSDAVFTRFDSGQLA